MSIWSRKIGIRRRRNHGRSCSNRPAVFGALRAAICGGKSGKKSIIWKILKFSSSKDIFLFLKKFYDKIFRPTRTEPPTFPQRTRLLSSKRATLMYSCWDRLEFFSDKKLTFLFRFGNWATETGEAHWTERNSSSRSNSLPRRSKVQFIYYYFLKSAPLKSLLQMPNDRKRSFQIREKKLKN